MSVNPTELEIDVELPRKRADRSIAVGTPAAGADFTYEFSRGFQLRSVSALLTCSATAGNRVPALEVTDEDGGILLLVPVATAITAGEVVQVTWAKSLGAVATATAQTIGIPDIGVAWRGSLASVTAALKSGDKWSNIRISGTYLAD